MSNENEIRLLSGNDALAFLGLTPKQEDIVHYSAKYGVVKPVERDGKTEYEPEIPEGYELASHSAAKDIVLADLETLYDFVDEEDERLDLIELADTIVESLLKVGVTIPDGLESPFKVR
jgi:hypothetical protein